MTATVGPRSLEGTDPITDATLFPLGSITKLYTTLLVMQLVDDHHVELDGPVQRYLPDLRWPAHPASCRITIRHLLSHTSGLDGQLDGDFGDDDAALGRCVAAAPRQLEQLSEPGAYFSYCDAGFVILGRLVERLRSSPWRTCIRECLLDPLQLTSTITDPSEARGDKATRGHLRNPRSQVTMIAPHWTLPRALWPSGGLWASIQDLLAISEVVALGGLSRSGVRIISSSSAAAMLSPEVDFQDRGAWGLGLTLYRPEFRLVGHDGFFVGQFAAVRAIPELGVAMALAANSPRGEYLERDLTEFLFGEMIPTSVAGPQPRSVEHAPVDPARFAGIYDRMNYRVTVSSDSQGALTLSGENLRRAHSSWPTVREVPLALIDGHTFSFVFEGMAVPVTFLEFDDEDRASYVQFWGRLGRRTHGADRSPCQPPEPPG